MRGGCTPDSHSDKIFSPTKLSIFLSAYVFYIGLYFCLSVCWSSCLSFCLSTCLTAHLVIPFSFFFPLFLSFFLSDLQSDTFNSPTPGGSTRPPCPPLPRRPCIFLLLPCFLPFVQIKKTLRKRISCLGLFEFHHRYFGYLHFNGSILT